jgi:hypothetical protein
VTREALGIRRSLTSVSPARYRPETAQSLINLALIYLETRNPGLALQAIREALTIRREFATSRQDKARIAEALDILVTALSAAEEDDTAEVRQARDEATAIRRSLQARHPSGTSAPPI